eukprot:6201940-Pleurochrysis_carterae.AAC.4
MQTQQEHTTPFGALRNLKRWRPRMPSFSSQLRTMATRNALIVHWVRFLQPREAWTAARGDATAAARGVITTANLLTSTAACWATPILRMSAMVSLRSPSQCHATHLLPAVDKDLCLLDRSEGLVLQQSEGCQTKVVGAKITGMYRIQWSELAHESDPAKEQRSSWKATGQIGSRTGAPLASIAGPTKESLLDGCMSI